MSLVSLHRNFKFFSYVAINIKYILNAGCSAGSLILETPVLPVIEGEAATLRCRTKTTSSNLIADFYKDGIHFGSSFTREMILQSVSTSDEGLYKCRISDSGESPESWVTVRGETPMGFNTVVRLS